jgi:hypothetical protein
MLPEMWALVVDYTHLGLDEMRALASTHPFFLGMVNRACERYFHNQLLEPLRARVVARLLYTSNLIDWDSEIGSVTAGDPAAKFSYATLLTRFLPNRFLLMVLDTYDTMHGPTNGLRKMMSYVEYMSRSMQHSLEHAHVERFVDEDSADAVTRERQPIPGGRSSQATTLALEDAQQSVCGTHGVENGTSYRRYTMGPLRDTTVLVKGVCTTLFLFAVLADPSVAANSHLIRVMETGLVARSMAFPLFTGRRFPADSIGPLHHVFKAYISLYPSQFYINCGHSLGLVGHVNPGLQIGDDCHWWPADERSLDDLIDEDTDPECMIFHDHSAYTSSLVCERSRANWIYVPTLAEAELERFRTPATREQVAHLKACVAAPHMVNA